ncbi:MAG: ABC transporter ATP-binding protein [bacterium]|nr:ABC transporter ATP-binding protein [bacterium]
MTNNKTPEITIKDLKKTYVTGEIKTEILHGIDLQINKGEITVILGASGSGKTTLMNIIGGIDKPTEGTVEFQSKDLAKQNDKVLTEYRRKNIGFVFQFYNLISTLTAIENVEVAAEVSANPMSPSEALKQVDLFDKKDNFPSQLSGGQQQKVSIARALVKNPSLILCDEPTGALDFKTGQLVLKTLADLNQRLKTTIIIITHSTSVAKLAHKIIYLGSGVIDKIEENSNRLKPEEINW